MAAQLSVAVRDAMANTYEATVGTAPIFEIRSGSQPASCAAADSGTLLASMTLPSDWLAAASSGAKTLLGLWQDLSANASGTAGHFRIKDSSGTTCHTQGSVTVTGGGGDVTIDNVTIAAGQSITITAFTVTMGNA